MRTLWHTFCALPFWLRRPIRIGLFLLVVLFVLYPDPRYLVREIRHVRQLNALPDPADPDLQRLLADFDAQLRAEAIADDDQAAIIEAVQPFVYRRIPYAWDWEAWGVVDYIPTVGEVIRRGREDCDGQAVVAAALLRAKGIAADLVGDPRHMWVRTSDADVMHPLDEAAVMATADGTVVAWSKLINFEALAFGIHVFPPGREIIIVAALIFVLLPERPVPKKLLAGTFLLLGCLLILRMLGQIHGLELTGGGLRGQTTPLKPLYFAWAAAHLLLGVVLVRGRKATAACQESTQIQTVRYVIGRPAATRVSEIG